jgi:hypothetical protein
MKYGPETSRVEAFIKHLKGMTPKQWDDVNQSILASTDAWTAATIARDAAHLAAWESAWEDARDVSFYPMGNAAGYAANEIQGAAVMRERGHSFYFLPMFGFVSPEDIPMEDAARRVLGGEP